MDIKDQVAKEIYGCELWRLGSETKKELDQIHDLYLAWFKEIAEGIEK